MTYTVRQLPSGFWAIFAGDEWIDAAQPTQEAALAFAERVAELAQLGEFRGVCCAEEVPF